MYEHIYIKTLPLAVSKKLGKERVRLKWEFQGATHHEGGGKGGPYFRAKFKTPQGIKVNDIHVFFFLLFVCLFQRIISTNFFCPILFVCFFFSFFFFQKIVKAKSMLVSIPAHPTSDVISNLVPAAKLLKSIPSPPVARCGFLGEGRWVT
jgi:hypothetical protein